MNTLLLLLIVCPLLGSAVFASVVALGFTIAWLPRLWMKSQSRSRALAASNG